LVIAGATLALRFVEALWLVLPSASAVPRANFRKIPKTFFTCVNQLCGWVGQEHGGSIPLAAIAPGADGCPELGTREMRRRRRCRAQPTPEAMLSATVARTIRTR
jgi:hypothetical protein